jgi:hypothetical protein
MPPDSALPAASPPDAVVERARELVAHAAERGLVSRLLGGAAIALRAAPGTPPALRREYNDIDLAVAEGAGRRTGEVLREAGLRPLSERFNSLHGYRRLVFLDGNGPAPLKVDVFVGDFEMCHAVPLRKRLEIDPLTLSPADLLLTKVQIVRLTAKDRLDLYCLLWNHEVGAGGSGADDEGPDGRAHGGAIDAGRIAELCARDWGLWRTVTANLADCRRLLGEVSIGEADRTRIGERLEEIERAIERAPKSLRWRARAKVGDRVRWFELPEEIDGTAPVPPGEGPAAAEGAAEDGEQAASATLP